MVVLITAFAKTPFPFPMPVSSPDARQKARKRRFNQPTSLNIKRHRGQSRPADSRFTSPIRRAGQQRQQGHPALPG
jgi:hypothetical protein